MGFLKSVSGVIVLLNSKHWIKIKYLDKIVNCENWLWVLQSVSIFGQTTVSREGNQWNYKKIQNPMFGVCNLTSGEAIDDKRRKYPFEANLLKSTHIRVKSFLPTRSLAFNWKRNTCFCFHCFSSFTWVRKTSTEERSRCLNRNVNGWNREVVDLICPYMYFLWQKNNLKETKL